jgi:hypothetical protein
MRRALLILGFALVASLCTFAQGSNFATAVAIDPNGTKTGIISDQSMTHWWKVTLTANGYLRVQTTSGGTVDVDLSIYDVNGTTYITGDSKSGTTAEAFAFLKPGTYYINPYRGGGTGGAYSLTTTFTSPTRNADTEPNDATTQALTLAPNSSSTGHIGFFGSGTFDESDYWKITTMQDGWLRVQVRSDSLDLRGDNLFDIDVSMYDINGISYLSGDSRSGTFSQAAAFLRPGTYYVKLYRGNGRAGSYEIKVDLFPPGRANDVEGNDTYQTASTATINGTVTGHIGYSSDGVTDQGDYWKFTIPGNGKVVVQITNDSLDQSGIRFDVDVSMYDVNGTSYITGDSRTGTFSECIAYLKGGTYYIRPYRGFGNGGSYAMTVNYTAPARADDGDGNDDPATAKALTYGVVNSGHIGYFGNGVTDNGDYWKLTAPSSDSIYIQITSDASVDVDLSIYDSNGSSYIAGDTRTSTYSQAGFKPVAGSTYYIRAYRGLGSAGSYSILATRSSTAVSVEKNPADALVPTELALEQNYPNPFNPSTTVRFSLPRMSDVRVAVYTMLGQEVAVLVSGTLSAAVHTATWNGEDSYGREMPSGTYLVRLQAGDKQIVRKAMLVR